MAESGFTDEDLETWIPARIVYLETNKVFGSDAAHTILDRLTTGLLVGRANRGSCSYGYRSNKRRR